MASLRGFRGIPKGESNQEGILYQKSIEKGYLEGKKGLNASDEAIEKTWWDEAKKLKLK